MDDWIRENLGFWLVGLYAVSESLKKLLSNVDFFHEWLKKRGIKTKRMIEREKEKERLDNIEKAIDEIKDTSKHNVAMFLEHEKEVVGGITAIKDEIVAELGKLHEKIDEQQGRLEEIDREGKKRDCAVLRDRILSGMRYFSQNKDEQGRVHISQGDYENMSAMFKEYFGADGNGFVKDKVYEEEFIHFIIDR